MRYAIYCTPILIEACAKVCAKVCACNCMPQTTRSDFFRPSSDSREILVLLVLGEEAVPVNISNSVIHNWKIGDYVACTYEFDWYVGIILDISIDNGDVYVKFMRPKGPSMLFKWLSKEDECWVALNKCHQGLETTKI